MTHVVATIPVGRTGPPSSAGDDGIIYFQTHVPLISTPPPPASAPPSQYDDFPFQTFLSIPDDEDGGDGGCGGVVPPPSPPFLTRPDQPARFISRRLQITIPTSNSSIPTSCAHGGLTPAATAPTTVPFDLVCFCDDGTSASIEIEPSANLEKIKSATWILTLPNEQAMEDAISRLLRLLPPTAANQQTRFAISIADPLALPGELFCVRRVIPFPFPSPTCCLCKVHDGDSANGHRTDDFIDSSSVYLRFIVKCL